MNPYLCSLTTLVILPFLSVSQPHLPGDLHFSENPVALLVKNDELVSPKEDSKAVSEKEESKPESIPAIEEFEKQKLNRLKRNVGRRFLAPRGTRPVVFYDNPEGSGGKISYKEKEGFIIKDVVQNSSKTMYSYEVKFDSGKIGYLSADAYALDILVREGNLIPVTRRLGVRQSPSKMKEQPSGQTIDMSSEAVEMVKNHITTSDPITGEKRTVEMRMVDARLKLPDLTWRYEAREIGAYRYRVTQHAEASLQRQATRTWIVDLYQVKVTPENQAAKRLYP